MHDLGTIMKAMPGINVVRSWVTTHGQCKTQHCTYSARFHNTMAKETFEVKVGSLRDYFNSEQKQIQFQYVRENQTRIGISFGFPLDSLGFP